MKLEAWTFGILAIFMAIVTPLYWWLSGDPTGTTALVVTFGLCALLFFYLFYTASRLPGPRPEDRVDGEIAERAGEQGFFSPYSWAPLFLGLALAGVSIGLVVGWWLVLISGAFVIVAVMQWVYEYYRGAFAH